MQMDIKKVAQLARIELTQEEHQMLEKQFDDILNYIHKINQLDIADVEPASHPFDLKNVFREDVVQPPMLAEELLRLAPKSERNMIHVPKIIGGKT